MKKLNLLCLLTVGLFLMSVAAASIQSFAIEAEKIDKAPIPTGKPEVYFSTPIKIVDEDYGDIIATIKLSHEYYAGDVVIPFTISGTAVNGVDYTITPSPLIIPAGAAQEDIEIYIYDDRLIERNEFVVIDLDFPTNAVLGAASVYTLTIVDNDLPPISEPEILKTPIRIK